MPLTPEQRRARYLQQQAKYAASPKIPCGCGCGALIPSVRSDGKPAKYSKGHNPTPGPKGQTPWNKGRRQPPPGESGYRPGPNLGRKFPPEPYIRRTAARLKKNGGVYQIKRGWKHTAETRARMAAANRKAARFGEANHFYGKTHSPETRARIAQNHKDSKRFAGANNPAWRGGISKEAYGPEFNRKFKQLILERDGHRCRRCGRTAEEIGRPLHVHHLDHNKRNNDPLNLVASCVSCNSWARWHPDEPFAP